MDKMTIDKKDMILAGKIIGVHGIRGGIKILSNLESPENFKTYKNFYLKGEKVELALNFVKGDVAVVHLNNIRKREEAEALKGLEIFINKNERPEVQGDEFYYSDLIGLKVIDHSNGQEVGTLTDIQNFGAGDLFEVQFSKDKKKQFFPYTKTNFPRVDIKSGKIMFVKPEEEFTENSDESDIEE